MLIKSLRVKNFRNLSKDKLEFTKGINLVKGPNEGGKSSLRQLINLALYTDPKSTSSKLQNLQTWGKSAMFEVSLDIRTNEGDYRLTKDFEAKTAVLEHLSSGAKMSGNKKIAEVVAQITGLPTEVLFKNTVYFSAEELAQIKNDSDLRSRLEEKLSGVEGVNIADLLKNIDQKLAELNRGVQKHSKNPGPIQAVIERLAHYRSNLELMQAEVDAAAGDMARLTETGIKLTQLQKRLEQKIIEQEKSLLWKNAKQKLDSSNRQFAEIISVIEQHRHLTNQSVLLGDRLKMLDQQLTLLEKALAAIEQCLEAAREAKAAKDKYLPLKDAVSRIVEAEKTFKTVEQLLRQTSKVSPEDLKACSVMKGQLDALNLAGKEQGFLVDIEKLSAINPEITVDKVTGIFSPGNLIDARSEIIINLPGIMKIKVTNKNQQAAVNLERERDIKGRLTTTLEKYEVDTLEALNVLSDKWTKVEGDYEKSKLTLNTLLGGREPEYFKTNLSSCQADYESSRESFVKGLPRAKESILAVDPSLKVGEDLIDDLKAAWILLSQKKTDFMQRKEAILREKTAVSKSYHEGIGVLKNLPPEEKLNEQRKDLALEVAKAEAVLEQIDLPDMSLEKAAALEQEINSLEKEINYLVLERKSLADSVARCRYGVDDIENIKDDIQQYEQRLANLQQEQAMLQEIKKMLIEASNLTLTKVNEGIQSGAEAYFKRITGERYQNIAIDSKFMPQVYSQAKGEYVLPEEELSTGTRDQAYLALRLALIPAIAKGCKPPLLIDDSLAFFDAGRRERAFEVLKELAGEHQIFLFSCHDYYDAIADHIINLP